MGTQQQLTTQQVELLILIKEIADFDKEQPGNIPQGGVGEIIVSNNIMTSEELKEVSEVLESYGYLHGNYELTMDGKQYVELFEEYLQEKDKNPSVENKPFLQINIQNLEVALAKIDIFGKTIKLLELIKGKK